MTQPHHLWTSVELRDVVVDAVAIEARVAEIVDKVATTGTPVPYRPISHWEHMRLDQLALIRRGLTRV